MTPPALELFAITAPGLEPLCAAELRALGIEGTVQAGGVAWRGTVEQMQEANLHLRTASRVLLRVAEFRVRAFYELERHARRVPWERWVERGGAVEMRVTSRKSRLYHQRAIAQRLLQAAGGAVGARPAPGGGTDPDDEEGRGGDAQLFVVRLVHDRCTLSVDTSGVLLHQRGYRQALARAPLRETLAAALLLASGWAGEAPLLDPMCGAGTIPIEAALIARGIAPGLAHPAGIRRYAFERWPEHDAQGWTAVIERARAAVRLDAGVPIVGSDRDAGAIEAALANAERAGVSADLDLEQRALSRLMAPPGPGWLVSNPPYGVRVGESDALRDLYAALGRTARQRLPGWTVALLTADRRLEGHTGIRWTEALRTRNGGIPVRAVVGRV